MKSLVIFCDSEGIASVNWVVGGNTQCGEGIGMTMNAALGLSSEITSLQPLTIIVKCLGVLSRILYRPLEGA